MNKETEVFDSSLEPLGIIYGISELQFNLKNSTNGKFIFSCPVNEENLLLVKRRCFVLFEGDLKNIFIIEYFKKIKTEDGVVKFQVQGRSAISIIGRRIIWGTYNVYNQTAGHIINEIIYNNMMDGATDTNRIIPIIDVSVENETVGSLLTIQSTGDNILKKVEELCLANDISIECILDKDNQKIIISVRQNVDHSEETENPVVFSSDTDDIVSSDYVYNEATHCNSVLIAGAGEGVDRVKKQIISGSGLSRMELYVDARDLQPTDAEGVTISDADYEKILLNRGTEKLAEVPIIETMSTDIAISERNQFKLGVDFLLGDKITANDKDISAKQNVQCTEFIYTFDAKGESTKYTLGEAQPTIYKLLKRR